MAARGKAPHKDSGQHCEKSSRGRGQYLVRVKGTETVTSRDGSKVLGFLIEGDRDGNPVKVVRSEADLTAFHRQLHSLQRVESKRNPQDLDQVLAFPGRRDSSGSNIYSDSEYTFNYFVLTAFVVACVAVDVAIAATGLEEMGLRVEFAALAALMQLVSIIALSKLLWGFHSSLGANDVARVEAYLQRVLLLRGPQTQEAIEALLEPPLRVDWPGRMGPIDLAIHDLPHPRSQTEWWYYHAHLDCAADPTGANRKLSVFVCFFRFFKYYDKHSGKRHFSHALTWAVSDVEKNKYYADVILEQDAPRSILKALDEGHGTQDLILQRAFREILEKGNVPLPDRLLSRDAVVKTDGEELRLDYEGGSLHKTSDGLYHLRASHYKLPCNLDLKFVPQKAPIRHGDHGVVKGREGDDMFYYCITRCKVTGSMHVPIPVKRGAAMEKAEAEQLTVVHGSGWYDHEFGGVPEEERINSKSNSHDDEHDHDAQTARSDTSSEPEVEGKGHADRLGEHHTGRYAWNWVAAQLDDNTEISAALLVNPLKNEIMEVKAIVIDTEGNRTQFDGSHGVSFTADSSREATWTSVRTFVSYPLKYHLQVPGVGLDLCVEASFPDQELMTLIAKPAFWEGRCKVYGTKYGTPVKGLAYVERNGFGEDQNIKTFFKNVGKKVRASVQSMYPLHPTYEEALELIATKDTPHYMSGVPLDVLGQTLIAPVRLIADRGGKSWRSYGALACVDCVGGDSRDFVDWVAMPEFLHVGSLIVDDIQDHSETRRGGPAAHRVYGDALCINAGTAAYFQCEQMIRAPGLTPEELNRCYALYFAALRGGHAGQALDINGLDYMMDEVVESGDASLLQERILGIHMLKTAVPAGTLARMGALVGKGSEEQIEAMGRYFESIGIAFQIMDDVLNLRGLFAKETDKLKLGTSLKRLGEDIVDGKVTFPVAKAMARLSSQEDRRSLWDTIRSKPQDQAVVDAIIQQLEELGAIDECVQQAENEVEQAWARLDSVIPDSFPKMMLRAFGSFVIERIG